MERVNGQGEMDLCCTSLAVRMEVEVLNKYEVEESRKDWLPEVEVPPLEWRRVRKSDEIQSKKVVRRLLGQEFSLSFEITTCSVCNVGRRELTDEEEMKQPQRIMIMKDLTKKMRSREKNGR